MGKQNMTLLRDWCRLMLSKISIQKRKINCMFVLDLARRHQKAYSAPFHSNRPLQPIFLSPSLLHNLIPCSPSSRTPKSKSILLLPIPSGQREPPLPIAKSMTLARLASPYSVNKQYEKQFTEGLRRFFESDVGLHGKRVVRQGDVIAVPICTATTAEDEDMSLLRTKPRYVE